MMPNTFIQVSKVSKWGRSLTSCPRERRKCPIDRLVAQCLWHIFATATPITASIILQTSQPLVPNGSKNTLDMTISNSNCPRIERTMLQACALQRNWPARYGVVQSPPRPAPIQLCSRRLNRSGRDLVVIQKNQKHHQETSPSGVLCHFCVTHHCDAILPRLPPS